MIYFLSFLFISISPAKQTASVTTQKIHELCMDRFPRTVDKRKIVCDCVSRNLRLKLDGKELKFVHKFLASKKEPLKMNDEQTMLIEYSNNVSEKCIENPSWVVNQDDAQ